MNAEKRNARAVGLDGHERGPCPLLAAGGRARFANHLSELAQRAGFEKHGQLEIHVIGLLDLRKQAHADQRVAAERKEVVVGVDLIDTEQILPPAGECRLNTLRSRR